MSSRPVFFDPSGKRGFWLKRAGVALAFATTVVATLFVLSLLAVPFLAPTGEGAALRLKHLLPTVPKPGQLLRTAMMSQAREKLLREIAKDTKTPKAVAAELLTKQHIVAAFYAPWQGAGLASLRAHAKYLTHLMPVWAHLDATGEGLDLQDFENSKDVVDIAHEYGLAVLPVLSNASDEKFDANRVEALLNSADHGDAFILKLKTWVLQNHFQGINLDFENLEDRDYDRLPGFISRLGRSFNADDLRVSVDVEASLDSDTLRKIAPAVEFIVLMTYDQHYPTGPAGPIAAWDWTVAMMQQAEMVVPPSKLVSGIGAFSYDWTTDGSAKTDQLTYQQAILTAHESSAGDDPKDVIDFDSDALNATFNYEEYGHPHEVWMQDAASAYNQWTTAKAKNWRGSAVWSLGQEDPSMWRFFRRVPLPADESRQFVKVHSIYEVGTVGNGEVLRVSATPQDGARKLEFNDDNTLVTDEEYDVFPTPYVLQHSGFQPKELALTFDDGPDPEWTPQVLDMLAKFKVHATFFQIGDNAERFPGLVRRVFAEGNDIGSHSFTHPNLGAVSPRRVELELNATQRAIQSILGRSTILFRPPYNADSDPTTGEQVRPVIQASNMGYLTVGEGIDPNDWNDKFTNPDKTVVPRTVEEIIKEVMEGAQMNKKNIILLHDAGGDRQKTVDALDTIIPELQAKGYKFVTVSQLLRQSRDQLMPPLTGKQRWIVDFDRQVFNFVFTGEWLLSAGFIAAIYLGLGRMALLIPLAWAGSRREKKRGFDPNYAPRVSVLIAAYNEANVVERTISSVLACDYPNFEVIVVDDGSTDGTGDRAEAAFATDNRVRVLRQANGGKSTALNHAISVAGGEIFVGFDADTQVAPDSISLLVRHFEDEQVGAVAGNVKVGNRHNALTWWQTTEYVTSQNLDRRAFAVLNSITVVPGAIGAWRKTAVQNAGGYLSDTLAEDMDLTWRLREEHWVIRNESGARAYTEAPETLPAFFKQRFRWAYGTLQCLAKHRKTVGRCGWFGIIGLPGIWAFQFILQWLAPCVDLQLGLAAFTTVHGMVQTANAAGHWQITPENLEFLKKTGFFYAVFFAAELAGAVLAVRLDREKPSLLWWLFWQRFVYRQILYLVVWKATWTALTGFRQGWGKLARKGTVSIPQST